MTNSWFWGLRRTDSQVGTLATAFLCVFPFTAQAVLLSHTPSIIGKQYHQPVATVVTTQGGPAIANSVPLHTANDACDNQDVFSVSRLYTGASLAGHCMANKR